METTIVRRGSEKMDSEKMKERGPNSQP